MCKIVYFKLNVKYIISINESIDQFLALVLINIADEKPLMSVSELGRLLSLSLSCW